MFENVNGRRTDDGRTPEHGYTISSPCEPEGSGELKSLVKTIFGRKIFICQSIFKKMCGTFYYF